MFNVIVSTHFSSPKVVVTFITISDSINNIFDRSKQELAVDTNNSQSKASDEGVLVPDSKSTVICG
jgi:hypothetical protein